MSSKDKKKRHEYQQRYNKSLAGKERSRKYNKTPRRKKYMRNWQRKYRQTQEAKEYDRKYRKEYRKLPQQKEYKKEYLQKYNKLPRVKIMRRNRDIIYRNGIDIDAYKNLTKKQHNKCAICFMPKTHKRFDIDHDHRCCPGNKSCGKCVRGLLCNNCNRALGHFHDSIEVLQNAIRYLKRYN